ncbi:MAG TPA: cytochrome c [Burkholderiales bacterium]|nr:cytochrome c [Burkholderiales bacterium]
MPRRFPREALISDLAARAAAAAIIALVLVGPARAQGGASTTPAGDAKRGEYLAKAAGCLGCHTEEKKDATPFAGGRALKTPFGTFYGPNITPDRKAGIGNWTEANFEKALRHGERPDGANYFPAFPYPSFTQVSDADVRDLWAYLRSLPPSPRANRAHDLGFPYGYRFLVTPWKWLFFKSGPAAADPRLDAVRQRGRYLVTALGHCGECHTPRNFLGGTKASRFLAGGKGPEGKNIPNLTPTRLKKWSDQEIKDFLVNGMYSDGDVPAEAMAEVIRNTTSKLTPADLDAMVAYLRTVPELPEEPKEKK